MLKCWCFCAVQILVNLQEHVSASQTDEQLWCFLTLTLLSVCSRATKLRGQQWEVCVVSCLCCMWYWKICWNGARKYCCSLFWARTSPKRCNLHNRFSKAYFCPPILIVSDWFIHSLNIAVFLSSCQKPDESRSEPASSAKCMLPYLIGEGCRGCMQPERNTCRHYLGLERALITW